MKVSYLKERLEVLERIIIIQTMNECGHNQSRASRELGISRTTLRTRLEQYADKDKGDIVIMDSVKENRRCLKILKNK